MIRLARPEDAAALAALHAAALPGDLLPRLGPGFLAESFYPLALTSPHAFTLVAEQDDIARGFVTFTHDSPGFMRALRSRAPAMLLAALGRFPRDPSVLVDLARCGFGFRCAIQGLTASPQACPELFVIVAAREFRGAGLGSLLVREGLLRLSETPAGARHGCLVKTSSLGAFEFYRKLGFRAIGREWRGPRVMHVLHWFNDESLGEPTGNWPS